MGKASLNFVMLHCAEKAKLNVRREFFSKFHEVPRGRCYKKPKFTIASNINRVETKKIPIPLKPNILYSALLLPLALQNCQLRPRQQRRIGDKHEKVTAILDCGGELGQASEGSEVNPKTYPEGGTASVACKGDPNKSGYLNFDPGDIFTIRWLLDRVQVSSDCENITWIKVKVA